GVERGGELLGALVRVDVHAEDAFVFGQDGALRESGQQHVPNAHRSVWGGAGNYLVAPELEPVGAVEQVVDLYVELPDDVGEWLGSVESDVYASSVFSYV